MSHITRKKEARESKEFFDDHGHYPWEKEEESMEEEKIDCKICHEETHSTGTKLCDSCWNADRNIDTLSNKNPEAATYMMIEKLKKMSKNLKIKLLLNNGVKVNLDYKDL